MRIPIFFSSGLTDPGEVVGFAEVGMNVGVSSDALHTNWFKTVETAILALKDTPTLVFLDNGAFGEVRIDDGKISVKKKISHKDWMARMELAVRWAGKLGRQLYMVAPDRVGSQAKTLKRLLKYSEYARKARDLGANVLATLQRGRTSYRDLDEKITKILGFADWIRAFPMKKKATPMDKLLDYIQQVKPARVHLLGLGPKRRGFSRLINLLQKASPNTQLYHDAVIIRSVLERAGEMGGKTRPLTAAQDEIRERIHMNLYGDVIAGLDFTEIWDSLDLVVETPYERHQLAECLGFTQKDEDYHMILKSVDEWVDRKNIELDTSYLWECVQQAWERKVLPVARLTKKGKIRYKDPEWVRSEIRRQAIVKVFGPQHYVQTTFRFNPAVLRPVRMSHAI